MLLSIEKEFKEHSGTTESSTTEDPMVEATAELLSGLDSSFAGARILRGKGGRLGMIF